MRQAVVLIHGIGEQKPMGTVRGFVKAMLGEGKPDEPTYWSKPDRMSQSFELRRLRARGQPSADFYEYYWAYNLYGTKLGDVLSWFKTLLLRRWKDVPPGARALWLLSRMLVLSVASIGIALGLGWGAEWKEWYGVLRKAGVASLLASGMLLLIQWVIISYIGDAARYLSPLPRNIRLRQRIRGECVALLRSLHDCGEYDRIVIVGHSLGSVIAYDAITHLWQEFNESLPGLGRVSVQEYVRQQMEAALSPQPAVREQLSAAAAALDSRGDGLNAFRNAQVAAAREQRFFGNRWLITDLVTVGSPLTHAPMLLASSLKDFGERQRERELPTCPPQRDAKGYAYSGASVDVGMKRKYTPLLLHHAAPFAVTRWTNLYFPATLGLFGDVVGGPLREHFGSGIMDVRVSSSSWGGLRHHTPLAHTGYWLMQDAASNDDASGRQASSDRTPSLLALHRALDLHRLRRFTAPLDRDKRHAASQARAKAQAPAPDPTQDTD